MIEREAPGHRRSLAQRGFAPDAARGTLARHRRHARRNADRQSPRFRPGGVADGLATPRSARRSHRRTAPRRNGALSDAGPGRHHARRSRDRRAARSRARRRRHRRRSSPRPPTKRAPPSASIIPRCWFSTGAVHEAGAAALAAYARDHEVAILALLEPTDSARLATRASRLAATEVLVKPVAMDELVATVRRMVERRELQRRTGIFGESAAIQEVLVKIEQMAPVSSTVLIQGESGTGKELVAKAIHDLSPRRGRPFIAVNCAALPETLLESELFGHEKGAFTGAAERRLGRFELADSGTIFLDEIGEIPPSACRSSCCACSRRARSSASAACSRSRSTCAWWPPPTAPLKDRVARGEFRDDLYYRLNVLSIYLPPLRERRDDIPLLVRRFVREFTAPARAHLSRASRADAMQRLVQAPWPGNVRQLRNLIESMVVLAPAHEIRAQRHPGRRDGGRRDAAADADRLAARSTERALGGAGVRVHPPVADGAALAAGGSAPPDRRAAPRRAGDRGDRSRCAAATAVAAVRPRRSPTRKPSRTGAGGALPPRDDDGRDRAERRSRRCSRSTPATAARPRRCWGSASGRCTASSRSTGWVEHSGHAEPDHHVPVIGRVSLARRRAQEPGRVEPGATAIDAQAAG